MGEKEYVPRRIYLRKKEFEEFGRTVGCKGCLAKMRGAVHAIHSDACRARMQKKGRRRVREASARIEVHCRDIHEERAAKRVKHGEITEQASSSGGAPSHIREGPSDVETKEMDTEEQVRAKRGRGCEHLEDDCKRARRMEHQADDDGDVLMELACTDDFEAHCELTTESEQERKNVEDKVCWADASDEPEFRDDRAAREEELKELESRVFVEADVEECVWLTGKKPIGVRWVDVDEGFGVSCRRLVAKDFRRKSGVDDVEGLYAATRPLELVKFLLTNAAASSRRGNVRKVMLIDIGKAHLYAPIEGEQCVDLPPERADRTQQLGERVHENNGGSGVCDGTCDGMHLLPKGKEHPSGGARRRLPSSSREPSAI